MGLRRNIAANYASQAYVSIVSLAVTPVYIGIMGGEAYGLIGFFTMLQAWFLLLDLGLTPTMAREVARFAGGAVDAAHLRRLLRILEMLFAMVGVLGGAAIVLSADAIAAHWLKVGRLALDEVGWCIALMGVTVAFRWMAGLYKSVVTGFEQLVWLSGFNALIVTLRFVGVLPVLLFVDARPLAFFLYQATIGVLEWLGLLARAYRSVPVPVPVADAAPRSPLRDVLRFSLSVAFTGGVWVLVTQLDKLTLSKVLPLAEFGYFSLGVAVAGVVNVVSGPVSGALLPALTRILAERDEARFLALYRGTTQFVAIVAGATAAMLAFLAEPILWAWTGDATAARSAAPVVRLYALGNAAVVLGAFAYYLQYAKGDVRLHLQGNLFYLLLVAPALVWASWRHGALGAGLVWLGSSTLYLLLWVPRVHARICPGLHWPWLLQDVLPIVASATMAAAVLRGIMPMHAGRLALACGLCGAFVLVLGAAALASSRVRSRLARELSSRVCANRSHP